MRERECRFEREREIERDRKYEKESVGLRERERVCVSVHE